MQIIVPKLPCIFCGGEVRKAKYGEHVIPDAIGGTRYIREFSGRNVCPACNNGPLSVADRELCSRSPLAVAAAQSLDAALWQTWEVDRTQGNLLLEARADFTQQSMTVYPQVILSPNGAAFRGDYEDMARIGPENFVRVLIRAAIRAFRHFRAGDDGWVHSERLDDHPGVARGFAYPPRLFSRSSIVDLAHDLKSGKKSSFIFRYGTVGERRQGLRVLEDLQTYPRVSDHQKVMGSALPAIRCFFDLTRTLRGLVKIGFNLLAAYCSSTPIDSVHCPDTTAFVLGRIGASPQGFSQNGFVDPSEFRDFEDPAGGHVFRIQHYRGNWEIQSSYFGGRVASFVRIAGPNREDWNRADVLVPLNDRNWQFTKSSLLLPHRPRIFWNEPEKMMPTAGFLNMDARVVPSRR